MDNNVNIYVLSFGNSAKYRVPFEGTPGEFEHSPLLKAVQKEIRDYVNREVGENNGVDLFLTPRIEKISDSDASELKDLKIFDSAAIESIKKVILVEVKDMQDLKMLNSNAPFAQI